MKRILLAGTFALGVAGPALAADLPQAPPVPQAPAAYVPAPPPVYDWSGIYVGVNGGYAFGDSSWGAPASTSNFDINGGLVGGTLGANFQSGQFVFGIEGDIDWTDITGSAACPAVAGITCQTSNDWLSTVRGRVGYAFERVLVYGTAGGAFGDVKSAPTIGALTSSTSSSEFGWTAGAGVEVGITPYLTARAEYLFVDLSNSTDATTSSPVSFDASLVRAGLNFKFNPF